MILVHKKICSLHVLLLFIEGFITVISVNEGNVPCSYEIYADKKLQFLKKVWSIETENFKIYYTLCGTLPYIFGNNTAASFLDKNLGAHKEFYTNIGTGFVINHQAVEPDLTMTSVNGTKCQYSTNKDYSININFQCSDDMDEQPLLVSSDDKCTFNITMMHPQCTPKCTFRFLNNFIDLRPLNGTHFVKAKDKSFALSLCAPAPECGADKGLSVCETNTRAIAKHNSLNVGYRNHKESLFLTGDVTHPVNQKKEVIFKLMFKCNWETPGKQLRYIEKSVQGSHYDFEIESSVGCFVQHASCELIDGHFLYNLSNLYNLHQDKWIVKNYHRELWLNICGPLHLTDSMASKCTNTKAQVCENDNGIFTNKGTQLSALELKDDIIRATIENGMVCNGTKNYRTLIDFFCDKIEYGPVFDKISECDTFIKWRTLQACPQFNVTRCKKEHNLIQANCTITVGEDIYDLSPLTLPNNKSHIIKNGKREFLINICQGIQEEDAPCSNDIFVAMRNTEQANNKYRITALGKKDRIDVTDTGTIVMQYKYGPICNDIFDEYSSEIHLVCSDIEEDPILIEQTECSFKFSWKTIHACPVSELLQKKAVEECSLTDLSTSKTIKFEHIHSSMRIKNHDTSYDFDICHNNFSMCTGGIVENCSYLPYESRVIQFPYLKMSLPKNCDSPDDFNKTEILLECDRFINNSHFTSPEISNCTFRFKYVTDRVCGPIAPLTTTSSPMKILVENIAKENQNHIMVTSTTTTSPRYRHAKFKGMELISDCSIINNITGYQYSLSKLGLNFTSICPYVTTISNKSMSLELQYHTEIRCKIRSDKHQSTYNIKILLQCSNGLSTQAKESFPDLCIDKYSYSKLEFCNFFNPFDVGERKSMEEVKGISIAGIIGIVIATTVVLILITFGITKYAKGKSKPQYCSVYYKNAGV